MSTTRQVLGIGFALSLAACGAGLGAAPGVEPDSSSSGEPRTAPSLPADGARVVQVVVGNRFTCARRAGGLVACWGADHDGVLGRDVTHWDAAPPGPVTGLTHAFQIAATQSSAAAVLANGQVVWWGKPAGVGGASVSKPQVVDGLDDAVQIALVEDMGGRHACARRAQGGVLCWGKGDQGALGDGTRVDRATPTAVSAVSDAVEIAVGRNKSCARRATGEVLCWGDGVPGDSPTPVVIPGLTAVTGLAVGWWEICGRRADGTVVCWRQIPPADSTRLRVVAGLEGVSQLAAQAQGDALCAVSNGRVRCWNDNAAPTEVPGLSDAVAVSVGQTHRCALRANGRVMCWGNNRFNELGLSGPSAEPVVIPGEVKGL